MLTKEIILAIIDACKKKGVSVTSAWHAVVAMATQHSVGSLQTALPFALHLGKDNTFDAFSQALHQQYKAPFDFAGNDFSYLNPYMTMSRQILESGGAPPSSTPYLSSMGVVDDFLLSRYGDWAIRDFWISSTMLTGDFQMYLWTFRGSMVLSACYNAAYYGTQRADQVLESTLNELARGLDVKFH